LADEGSAEVCHRSDLVSEIQLEGAVHRLPSSISLLADQYQNSEVKIEEVDYKISLVI
jgi:hypothetical protein